MSLFKKPSRKFRQRISHQDSDEEGSIEKLDIKPPINTINLTNLSQGLASTGPKHLDDFPIKTSGSKTDEDFGQKSIGSKLLSFHEEEEETEVFKVKKSNYSRRLAKQRERERKKGTSDKKENAEEIVINLEPTISLEEEQNENEPTIIVKPLSIPKISSNNGQTSSVLNGEEAEDMGASEEEDDDGHKYNPFKNALQSGIIPDAATIFALKKQRQMAREMGDFIPVDDTEKFEDEKSRLIRDDDNDRSDEDEESGRINFSVNMAALDRQKARDAFLSAQSQSIENDEADELENWEREQIRKGVGIVQIPSSQQQELDKGLFGLRNTAMNTTSGVPYIASYETVKHEKKVTPPMIKDRLNLTTQSIKARLNERLTSLNEVHRAHKLEFEKYKDELVNTYDNIERLKSEGPELDRQFNFYQEMRAYVEDLSECMDLKLPKVDLLEQRITDLYKTRVDKLIARRQQDIKDQSEEYSVLANKAMRGLPIDFMEDKPIHDEIKSRRAAEREGRRMRRRKFRETDSTLRVSHNDGMSSDEEEADNDVLAFKNEYDDILAEARVVFNDVVDEFGTLEGVISSFLKWRDHQIDSYKDAYVSLCLPKVFSVFVRLELLSWNPLESKKSLESMIWHKNLLFYGWNPDIEAWTKMKEDPDANLIPSIIDKVVLPRLSNLVEHCWDPLSSKQTLKLVKTVSKLCQDSPTLDESSKRLQELLKCVVSRFQKSLEDDIYIPLYPKQLLDSRTSSVAVFFSRQFWTSVKLLHNILTWHGLLAEAPLQELALGCLLNRYIVLALQSFPPSKSMVEKCKTVLNTFPRTWFSGGKSIPQLDMLQRFIVQLGGRCKTMEEGETLNWCIREMISMLNTMGAQEKAALLAKEFGISSS